jgi:hypothetical protein
MNHESSNPQASSPSMIPNAGNSTNTNTPAFTRASNPVPDQMVEDQEPVSQQRSVASPLRDTTYDHFTVLEIPATEVLLQPPFGDQGPVTPQPFQASPLQDTTYGPLTELVGAVKAATVPFQPYGNQEPITSYPFTTSTHQDTPSNAFTDLFKNSSTGNFLDQSFKDEEPSNPQYFDITVPDMDYNTFTNPPSPPPPHPVSQQPVMIHEPLNLLGFDMSTLPYKVYNVSLNILPSPRPFKVLDQPFENQAALSPQNFDTSTSPNTNTNYITFENPLSSPAASSSVPQPPGMNQVPFNREDFDMSTPPNEAYNTSIITLPSPRPSNVLYQPFEKEGAFSPQSFNTQTSPNPNSNYVTFAHPFPSPAASNPVPPQPSMNQIPFSPGDFDIPVFPNMQYNTPLNTLPSLPAQNPSQQPVSRPEFFDPDRPFGNLEHFDDPQQFGPSTFRSTYNPIANQSQFSSTNPPYQPIMNQGPSIPHYSALPTRTNTVNLLSEDPATVGPSPRPYIPSSPNTSVLHPLHPLNRFLRYPGTPNPQSRRRRHRWEKTVFPVERSFDCSGVEFGTPILDGIMILREEKFLGLSVFWSGYADCS